MQGHRHQRNKATIQQQKGTYNRAIQVQVKEGCIKQDQDTKSPDKALKHFFTGPGKNKWRFFKGVFAVKVFSFRSLAQG
jgi:hypothetical protein